MLHSLCSAFLFLATHNVQTDTAAESSRISDKWRGMRTFHGKTVYIFGGSSGIGLKGPNSPKA